MKSTDQYNFSLFSPRNLHGKKNRNVILTMLLIWAVAVFGFQFLLRGMQKPTPEKTLALFESTWPAVRNVDFTTVDFSCFFKGCLYNFPAFLTWNMVERFKPDRGKSRSFCRDTCYSHIPDLFYCRIKRGQPTRTVIYFLLAEGMVFCMDRCSAGYNCEYYSIQTYSTCAPGD